MSNLEWKEIRLKNYSQILLSNIDKKSYEGEESVFLCNYTDVYKNKKIHKNIEFMPATASKAQITKLTLRYKDVIITKDSESADDIGIPAVVEYTAKNLVCGYHLAIIRSKKLYSDFISYIFQSKVAKDYFLEVCLGFTRVSLNKGDILNFTFKCPPLQKQTAIANYLDHHTAKIDKEINLLEQKVEKLDEYKKALIYETVTKGLDKNVNLKDSGIEWIGMIPEHWEVKRVKDFAQCYAGGTPETNKEEYWENGTNYWAASGNLKNGLINLDILKKITDLAIKNSSTKKINPFNTLIAMTGATCGEVGYSDQIIYANQSVCTIKNKKHISYYKFIFYFLLSARKSVESLKLGGAQAGINVNDVKHIKVVFPNFEEQKKITNLLDEQCAKIDKKKEFINKKINLLKEYKQSLIYEAVTGKIEIDLSFLNSSQLEEELFNDLNTYMSYQQRNVGEEFIIDNKDDLLKIKNILKEKKYNGN